MSSISDAVDIDIEVRRRGSGYILIAHKFSVVVRSKELKSGIEELERRVAIVSADFHELGIIASSSDRTPIRRETSTTAPSLLIIVTVGTVLASFVLLSTAPIVAAIASVRSEISAFAPKISALAPSEPGRIVERVGRLGTDFIIKFSETLDQVTPERKADLRTAIRRIAREADLIIEDVRTSQPPPTPPPSSGGKP